MSDLLLYVHGNIGTASYLITKLFLGKSPVGSLPVFSAHECIISQLAANLLSLNRWKREHTQCKNVPGNRVDLRVTEVLFHLVNLKDARKVKHS